VKVRPIQPDDRAPLGRLLRSIEQFKPEEVDVAEELIVASIDDPEGSGYETLVAEDVEAHAAAREPDQAGAGAQLAGYICYGRTPMTHATYDLYWIAVDPARQGRGIGRRLYDAFVARLLVRGPAQIRIETSSKESYAATGGFYERLGFGVDGRLRDFYAEGDDLLIFYKKVQAGAAAR
jgi:ribosomal protein S18 acetylase RimI-like enzyme